MVLDTSALLAVLLGEPAKGACIAAIGAADAISISAGTLTEALIVSSSRGVPHRLEEMMAEIDPEIVEVTARRARLAAAAHRRWGKGHHPAALNFGDCFAYALAIERHCPLLFVGEDFARTDVDSALATG
jgi:ribonuclease VapC